MNAGTVSVIRRSCASLARSARSAAARAAWLRLITSIAQTSSTTANAVPQKIMNAVVSALNAVSSRRIRSERTAK